MNSVSPGTRAKRCAAQSSAACTMRSRRDETKFHQIVPPDIARPIDGFAADQHAARGPGPRVVHRDRVTGAQHQELTGGEAVRGNLHLAADRVEGTLLVSGVHRQRRAGLERHVGIDRIGEDPHR
jgi:hypothetical protein